MQRREFLSKGAVASAGALVLPGLVACSPKPASLQTVNIVSTSGTTNLVLSQLLSDMGYLKEQGVTPNFINVADGNKVVAALISGAADICPAAGIAQVLAAIAKGAPLRVIAGSSVKNYNALMSGNPAVKTLKDLEGKSIGIGALGSQLHQVTLALLTKYGVDTKKIKWANVGASVDVLKAVQARVVDAGMAEVWLQRGTDLHIVENGKTFESLPEFVNQSAFTSQKVIAEKRDLIVRTLAGYAKLFRFVMTGDSEAAFIAASAKALGKDDPDAARAQYEFYRQIQPFAADLSLGEAGVKYMQDLNMTVGTQKEVLPYDKVTDMSLARDALKLVK